MTISGVIDVTNVTHGISIYGRLLSKTSNNTCIFSSGQDKTEAGDIYTAPVSISDLAKRSYRFYYFKYNNLKPCFE